MAAEETAYMGLPSWGQVEGVEATPLSLYKEIHITLSVSLGIRTEPVLLVSMLVWVNFSTHLRKGKAAILILSTGLANITGAAYKDIPDVSSNASLWQVFCYIDIVVKHVISSFVTVYRYQNFLCVLTFFVWRNPNDEHEVVVKW